MSHTLEQYLSEAFSRTQIDHVLRAHRAPCGKVTFYVRPLNGDGETLDFVVRGNAMVLNQTNDSDVQNGVEAVLAARIPILDQISELCYAIEKCGASLELTDAVTKASALREPISKLVEQAIDLGVASGFLLVDSSDAEVGCTNASAPQSGEGLNFGQAIELLKTGHRVARAGWNGKGMWIAYTPGSEFAPEFAKAGHAAAHRAAEEPNEPVRLLPHIDMRAADGSMVVGWLASQTDMLADDWLVA